MRRPLRTSWFASQPVGMDFVRRSTEYLSFEFRVFIQRTDHTLAGLPTTDRPPSNLVASPRYN